MIESTGKVSFYVYDGSPKTLNGATAIGTGSWHCVATLADGTNMKIFLDGAQDASQSCGNTFAGYSHAGWRLSGFDFGNHGGEANPCILAFAALSSIARSADWIKARSYNLLSGGFTVV
jgi:hypothetical protein